MLNPFNNPEVQEQLSVLFSNLAGDIWATLYSTVLATIFAYIIGLPLGILLVTGEKGGVRPLPGALMKVLNFVINILRSVPFLILMIMAIPLSRLILGTSVGTNAMIPPLVIAAFPFVARMVESSLREVDHGVLEAAQAMGASPFQIVRKVLLPEALPSLLTSATTVLLPQPAGDPLRRGDRAGDPGADHPVRRHPHRGGLRQAPHQKEPPEGPAGRQPAGEPGQAHPRSHVKISRIGKPSGLPILSFCAECPVDRWGHSVVN